MYTIKLTPSGDGIPNRRRIYVNPAHIISFSGDGTGTWIDVVGGAGIRVNESPEAVDNALLLLMNLPR